MKIPATVITGFLGAGKTSLIRHLLANAGGARLAIVINEFGDVGVDREMLLGCADAACDGSDIVELANGCICCTVADEFLPTMTALLSRAAPPDHIIIETSGLALPKPLVKAFTWPDVRSRLTVDGVIVVVDAPAVAGGRFDERAPGVEATRQADPAATHDSPLAELFEDQLACADMVVLNKIDALDSVLLDQVRASVRAEIRPETKIVSTVQGALDPRVALGLRAAAEASIDQRPSHHDAPDEDHDHDEFVSFVASLGPIADPAALERRIRSVAASHDVLRVKGFVDVPGRPMRHVIQAVGSRIDRYYDRPWRDGEERRTELVVIAQRGIDEALLRSDLLP
jgi:cobalamin biosynthesis protein CobW